MARLGFGQTVGQGAGEELTFRVFQRVAGVAELTGCIKEFGIAHALGCPALEIVEGASG
jgi:hypothetical protein